MSVSGARARFRDGDAAFIVTDADIEAAVELAWRMYPQPEPYVRRAGRQPAAMTRAQVARELGLTPEQVAYAEQCGLRKLRRLLGEDSA